jgi:hypothetical protein
VVLTAAINALGAIGDAHSVGPLVTVLGEGATSLRTPAASALGNIRDSRAVDALIQALSDSDIRVRAAAADALGSIRDRRAVDALLQVLGNPDSGAQVSAAAALGHIGDSRAVEPVIQAVRHFSEEQRIRVQLAFREADPATQRRLAYAECPTISEFVREVRHRPKREVSLRIGFGQLDELFSELAKQVIDPGPVAAGLQSVDQATAKFKQLVETRLIGVCPACSTEITGQAFAGGLAYEQGAFVLQVRFRGLVTDIGASSSMTISGRCLNSDCDSQEVVIYNLPPQPWFLGG